MCKHRHIIIVEFELSSLHPVDIENAISPYIKRKKNYVAILLS